MQFTKKEMYKKCVTKPKTVVNCLVKLGLNKGPNACIVLQVDIQGSPAPPSPKLPLCPGGKHNAAAQPLLREGKFNSVILIYIYTNYCYNPGCEFNYRFLIIYFT